MRRAINKRLSHTHRPKHWSGTASIVDLNNNNEDISLTLHNDRKLRSACHASQSTSLTGGPSSKQDVPLLYHSSFHISRCIGWWFQGYISFGRNYRMNKKPNKLNCLNEQRRVGFKLKRCMDRRSRWSPEHFAMLMICGCWAERGERSKRWTISHDQIIHNPHNSTEIYAACKYNK